MAFSTVSVTKIGMIFGGVFLISVKIFLNLKKIIFTIWYNYIYYILFNNKQDEPLAVKIQFGIMVISTTVNIYVCTWAADYLITIVRNYKDIFEKQTKLKIKKYITQTKQ